MQYSTRRALRRAALSALAGLAATAGAVVGAPVASALPVVQVDGANGTDTPTCGAVGEACASITQGIANVDPGGVVNVAAGTYVEQVVITKSLTLQGAGIGQTIIAGGEASPSIAGQLRLHPLDSSSITVSNVTVTTPGSTGPGQQPVAVYLRGEDGQSPSFRLSQIEVDGSGDPANEIGVNCYLNDANVVLEDSAITNTGGNPVLFERCTGRVTVEGNEIVNGDPTNSAAFFMQYGGAVSEFLRVRDNTVTGGGVSVNGAFGGSPGSFAEVEIDGNRISGAPANGVSLTALNGDLAHVLRNTVLGNDATGAGVRLVDDSQAVVGVNTISGFATGVRAQAAAGQEPPGNHSVLANRIVGNTVGAENASAVPLVARNNWWGCNGGPGATGCAPNVGSVLADPWLVLAVSATPSTVGLDEPSAVKADLQRNSAGVITGQDFPDGVTVDFATNLGTVTPTSDTLDDLSANTTFSSASYGTATVTATLDGQTVSTVINVPAPKPVCKLIRLSVKLPWLPPIVVCI